MVKKQYPAKINSLFDLGLAVQEVMCL